MRNAEADYSAAHDSIPSTTICCLSSVDYPELAAMLASLLVHNRATLYSYVSANVAELSRAKGVIYEQTPFVDGRGGKL